MKCFLDVFGIETSFGGAFFDYRGIAIVITHSRKFCSTVSLCIIFADY